MAEIDDKSFAKDVSRRQFVKATSTFALVGATIGANRTLLASAHVGGGDEIKIALVGCGGRGTSAALEALQTEGKVTLWAMADTFEDRLQSSFDAITREVTQGKHRNKPSLANSTVNVPKERQFVGFDAYRKAIESDAHVVILATPPGFRPIHFEHAVNAGKHVFLEKPVAVDAPGIRRVIAANEIAKQRDLKVAVGFQRRHDKRYIETIQRLRDGEIGDIHLTRVYYNIDGLWHIARKPEHTEMEYQMRNWYYFNWLCGDNIVEQHIHNIDVSNWLRGMHPVKANGMGGRQVRVEKAFGQIFDHHFVEFTYPDGATMLSQCRHIPGCWTEIGEYAHGSKGIADVANGRIRGTKGNWRGKPAIVDPYQQEHHDLFGAIRRGDPYNEGDVGIEATMTAILGRLATYSGKTVAWDEGLNSQQDLSPSEYSFSATPSVVPDEHGDYPIPIPGREIVV